MQNFSTLKFGPKPSKYSCGHHYGFLHIIQTPFILDRNGLETQCSLYIDYQSWKVWLWSSEAIKCYRWLSLKLLVYLKQ